MTQGEGEQAASGWRAEAAEWVKTAVGAFLAFIAFTTVAFAQYEIPSESMVPHLEVGDRVTVSKFAYVELVHGCASYGAGTRCSLVE